MVNAFYDIIDIGQKVKIIDSDHTYTTHIEWIQKNSPIGCNWKRNELPFKDEEGIVVCYGDRTIEDPIPVYGVIIGKTIATHRFYILHEQGIEKLKDKMSYEDVRELLKSIAEKAVQDENKG